ncbi:isoaspartyl peptidase/L-asparaginase [Tunturiibacter gelidiferens]|uniref:isoaspartyl peptidase/L-asparaginase n=1 Tax=Tunturiibacter gelidiferens TaxID=3069689 RepID=UPI003D9B04F7
MSVQPVLLIHGGAWAMPDDAIAAHEDGIANALAAGYALLERGAAAVDAVEAAVAVMEDDDTFDAGRGSFLTQDGRVQMDALLMNGENLRTGGVACVERLRNPIRAARLVLDKSPHVYFVGTGAERFARQHGMALCDNTELVVPRERSGFIRLRPMSWRGCRMRPFRGVLSRTIRWVLWRLIFMEILPLEPVQAAR